MHTIVISYYITLHYIILHDIILCYSDTSEHFPLKDGQAEVCVEKSVQDVLLVVVYIVRHWLNGYFAQGVPSLFLANSFRMCFICEVLKGMFPLRARYPSS